MHTVLDIARKMYEAEFAEAALNMVYLDMIKEVAVNGQRTDST